MKEDWKSLIGKRILLKRKYISNKITEATVLDVAGKYVHFEWDTGAHSWEIPEDEPSFGFTEILEVLDKEFPKHITLRFVAMEGADITPMRSIEIKVWDDISLEDILNVCEGAIRQIEVW